MTNDLVKIAKDFPEGFIEITDDNGEKKILKQKLDSGDLAGYISEYFGNRFRYNLLELKLEFDKKPLEVGIDKIGAHEKNVIDYGTALLDSIDGVNVFGKAPSKTGVVSFTMECAHSHDIETIIDREGIAVRAGHHCAQPLMKRLGVSATTRASMSFYNTIDEINQLGDALKKVSDIFAN